MMRRKKKYATGASRPLDDFEFDRLTVLLEDYIVTRSEVVLSRIADLIAATGRDAAPYISKLTHGWPPVHYQTPPSDESESKLRELIFDYSLLTL